MKRPENKILQTEVSPDLHEQLKAEAKAHEPRISLAAYVEHLLKTHPDRVKN